MTAVVLLADVPAMRLVDTPVAARVTTGVRPSQEELGQAIDLMATAQEAGHRVLVLYPSWRADPARRLLPAARAVLGPGRIASVGLDLPPLALSLAADQIAYLAEHTPAGSLAAAAVRLGETLLAGAWVNSVAKLEHVATGLGEHVASLLPGTGFVVTAAPAPAVHRATSAAPMPTWEGTPVPPVTVVAAHEGVGPEWAADKLAATLHATLRMVPPQPLGREFWGTRKYVEWVAFSGHRQALAHVLRSLTNRLCDWCGELVAFEVCPFCAMAGRVEAPHPATVTQPDTKLRTKTPTASVEQDEQPAYGWYQQ